MKIKRNLFALIILATFSCVTPAKTVMYIANKQVDCVGVGPQKCMQIKYEKQSEWSMFYDQINDFTYEPGFYYKIEVSTETIDNPPADASSIKYTLVGVLDKSTTAIE